MLTVIVLSELSASYSNTRKCHKKQLRNCIVVTKNATCTSLPIKILEHVHCFQSSLWQQRARRRYAQAAHRLCWRKPHVTEARETTKQRRQQSWPNNTSANTARRDDDDDDDDDDDSDVSSATTTRCLLSTSSSIQVLATPTSLRASHLYSASSVKVTLSIDSVQRPCL